MRHPAISLGLSRLIRAVCTAPRQLRPNSSCASAFDLCFACLTQDYPVYPPSLYRSISYASTLGVPVYIMENGIPAAKDDPSRRKWISGCLQQARSIRYTPRCSARRSALLLGTSIEQAKLFTSNAPAFRKKGRGSDLAAETCRGGEAFKEAAHAKLNCNCAGEERD